MKKILVLIITLIPIFLFSQTRLKDSIIIDGTITEIHSNTVLIKLNGNFTHKGNLVGRSGDYIFFPKNRIARDFSNEKIIDFRPGRDITKGANRMLSGTLIFVGGILVGYRVINSRGERSEGLGSVIMLGGAIVGIIFNIAGLSKLSTGGKKLDAFKVEF